MKIDIEIFRKKRTVIPRLNAVISCMKPRFFGRVTFLVDTGSTSTALMLNDVKILKIPYQSLPKRDEPSLTVSGKVYPYILKRVVFRCMSDKGLFKTTLSEVIIVEEAPRGIHSLLGNDFIDDNKLKLIFSPHQDIGYLERESED